MVITSPVPQPNLANVGTIANPTFVPTLPSFLAGLASGIGQAVQTGIAASRAGLTGAALQSAVVRPAVLGVTGALPGVGLLSVVEPLVRLLGLGPSTLPEYQRREILENPNYIRPSARLELIQQGNLADYQRRQAIIAASQAEYERLLAQERARVARQTGELQRARRQQTVPFRGVPSIFTRRRRN